MTDNKEVEGFPETECIYEGGASIVWRVYFNHLDNVIPSLIHTWSKPHPREYPYMADGHTGLTLHLRNWEVAL